MNNLKVLKKNTLNENFHLGEITNSNKPPRIIAGTAKIKLYRLVLLLMLVFVLEQALGQQTTFTWTGATNNNWNVNTNWTKVGGTSTSSWPGQNSGQIDYAIINTAVTIGNIPNITLNAISSTQTVTLNSVGGSTITINNTDATAYINVANTRTLTFGGGTAASAVNLVLQTITTASTITGTLSISANSAIDCSSNLVSGTGTFALAANATLTTANTAGITAAVGTATGSIRTTGGRTFTAGANYVYNGTSNQATGTGLTANTPANLTINNPGNTVTLSAATTIIGRLTMTSGTLDMANTNLSVGSLTGSSDLTHSSGVAGVRTLTIGTDGTSPAAYGGVISNGTSTSVSVTKTGAGTLTLFGTNTFTGGTTLSAGTLTLNNPAALGATGASIALNGGTLDLATNSSINAYNVTMGANSTIVSNRATSGAGLVHTLGTLSIGNFTLNTTVGANVSSGTAELAFGATTLSAATPIFNVANGTNLTVGALTGNFAFTKQNNGQLILNSASTRSAGVTTILAGTLRLENSSALGTTATTITLSGGTLDLATDATVNAYNITVGATSTILSNRATSGIGIIHTLGTLSIGNFTLNTIVGANVSSGTAELTFGATTLSAATPIFNVASGANVTLGALTGNFAFTKQNNGQLTLNTASGRSAGVTTLSAGTMKLGNSSALGTTGTTLSLNGGTLDLAIDATVNAYNTTVGGAVTIVSNKASAATAGITHILGTLSIGNFQFNLLVGSNVSSGTAGLTFGNTSFSASTPIFDVTSGANLTLGALQTVNNFTKQNSGQIMLNSAANAARTSGTVTLSAGTMKLGSVSALGTTGVPLQLNGGTLDLAIDATVNAYNVTVGGATTIASNKATLASAGIAHTLGTLSIGNFQLNLSVGSNVSSGTAGLTFGNTSFSASTPVFDVASGANLTLGALQTVNNFTKQNSGQITLNSAANAARTSGTVTLSAGTMKLGSVSALGTTGVPLQLNGGTLDLAIDATVNAYNTTFGGTTMITPNRATGGVGITHTLGTLTIGNNTLSTSVGSNVSSGTAGVTFGVTTLSASTPVFDVSSGTQVNLGVTNAGTVNLTKNGSGTLSFNGAFNLNGLNLNSGTINLTNSSQLNGTFNLNGGLMALNAVNLTLSPTSTTAGTFSSFSMITSTGGNVIKQFTTVPLSIVFPMGTGTNYTPAQVDISSATIAGTASITVRPVAAKAPNQLDNTYSLNKYWIFNSSNLSGINANLIFNYINSEADASTEAEYIPASYNGATWTTGSNADVDETNDNFSVSITGAANLNNNYTVGPPVAFGVVTFYSLGGNWDTPSSWSQIGYGGAASSVFPTVGSNVMIGNGKTITVINSNAKNINTLTIESSGTLNMQTFGGLTINTFGGNGLLQLASNTFPTITANNFLTTAGSTVEFNGGTFTLPAGIVSYRNLIISGGGALTKTLGATTTINEGLTIAANTSLQLSTLGITVNGASIISGTLNDNSATGANLFAGLVNISGGVWTTTNNPAFTFQGGITNAGTMTATGTGTYTFSGNSQNISGANAITFGGNISILGAITLTNQNTNTVTITGTLDGNNIASTWENANGSTLNYNSGTQPFNTQGVLDAHANSNTVNYFPNAAQNIKGATYYNLTFSGGGVKTLQNDASILNDLTINAGCTFNLGTVPTIVTIGGNANIISTLDLGTSAKTVSINGNATIDGTLTFGGTNAKTLNIGGDIINITGILTMQGAGLAHTLNLSGINNTITTFNTTASSGSTVNFNRTSGTQYVLNLVAPPISFQNITFSGGGIKQLTGNILVLGDFTATSCTVDLQAYTANRSAAGGVISIDGTSVLQIGGINTFPTNYSTINLLTGSTVEYNGGAQTIRNTNYHHLVLSGSGVIKTLSAGTTLVGGNLTINAGGNTLSFGAVAATTLSISGDLSSSTGTINMAGAINQLLNLGGVNNSLGTYTGVATSFVNYNGTGAQNLFTSLNYQNIDLSGGGLKSLLGVITVNKNLNLTNGILNLGNFDAIIANNATISGSFNQNRMIACSALGSLKKQSTTSAGFVMTYPVGTGIVYTPMTITSLAATLGGTEEISVQAVASTAPLSNSTDLNKHWLVNASSGITNINANISFLYDITEVLGNQARYSPKVYYSGSWKTPAGSSAIGVNPLSTTGTDVITGTWTALEGANTYYSYNTGNWNVANTWTTDPSGTELISPKVPADGDKIVILNGYDVTLTADVSTLNNSLVIENGGSLIMGNYKFTNPIDNLDGSGTISSSLINTGVGYFPVAVTNNFVDSGGGTYIYLCNGSFILPSQVTYNNLTLNLGSAANIATLINNLNVNGDLNITNGRFKINDDILTARLTITVLGDVSVGVNGRILTGLGNVAGGQYVDGTTYHNYFHKFNIYGNFTNNGSVRFTNQTAPAYNAFPLDGAVDVFFKGTQDNLALLQGVTDFYDLIIDKGTDKTYILEINSTSTNNFTLFGRNDIGRNQGGSYSAENPEVRKALWLKNGTLKFTGKINIPTLSEGSVGGTGNGDYAIGANARLWISSIDAAIYSTAEFASQIPAGSTGLNSGGTATNQALSLYGTFQISDGFFGTRNSAGFIFWNTATTTPEVIIEGGSVDVSVFRSAGAGAKSSYIQTGGTFTARGDIPTVHGEVDNGYPIFGIMDASCTFNMSGGTLQLLNSTTNAGVGFNGLFINSAAGNFIVTGGKVIIALQPTATSTTFDIQTTANLYNLDITRTAGAGVTINMRSNLQVNGSLLIGDRTSLVSNNFNLLVAQNFTLGQTAGTNTALYTPGTNTTSFFGNTNSNITVLNNNVSTPLNFYNLTIDKDISTNKVTLVSASRTGLITDPLSIISSVTGTLSVNNSILDYGIFRLGASGNIVNAGVLGPDASTGRLLLNGSVLQTITGSVFTSPSIGNLEINNTNVTAGFVATKLLSDMTVNQLTMTSNHRFDIGVNGLYVKTIPINAGGAFGINRMIQTAGSASDKSLKYFISLTGSYTNYNIVFPIGNPANALRWYGVGTGHQGYARVTTEIYTPLTAIVNGNPGTVSGTLTALGVDSLHPSTNAAAVNRVIHYYWRTKSTGFTGINNGAVVFNFTLFTPVTNYNNPPCISAHYVTTGIWVNTHTCTNGSTTIPYPALGMPSGDFSAGGDGDWPFNNVLIYYSRRSGAFNAAATWSTDGTLKHNGAAAGSTPAAEDQVVIGSGNVLGGTGRTIAGNDSIWITGAVGLDISKVTFNGITATTGVKLPVLNIANNAGQNRRIDILTGAGKLSVNSNVIPVITATDYGDFINNDNSIIEFYGGTYTLPALTTYPTLLLSGANTFTMPNNDVLVRKKLRVCSGSTLLLSNAANGNMNVNGNIEFSNTSTLRYQATGTVRTLNVYGKIDFRDNTNNVFEVATSAGSALAHTLNFYGDSIKMRQSDIAFWKTNNSVVNLNILGSTNTVLTNRTAGANIADFNNVVINKDLPSNTVSLFDVFTLNGPINGAVKALDLQTGALVIDNALTTIAVNSGGGNFNIPSTTSFNLKHGRINLSGDNTGIYLDGLLKLENDSRIDVGNSGSVENTYIEYSSSGNAQLDISGTATLNVNSQIRRSTINLLGVLKYYQTGGNVTIFGIDVAATPYVTRAKLEIANTGSTFNMSAGTLTLVRGGGTSFGDLYLRPALSTVSAGNIILSTSTGISVAEETFKIDASIPLYQLTVTGFGATDAARAVLNVNPLFLKNNLTLTNANSYFSTNDLNLDIKGNLSNSGTFTAGTLDVTSFTGVTQTISGSNTTFNKLTLNPSTSVTLSALSDVTVNKDLTLSSGTFNDGQNTVTVKGNITNNAIHFSPSATIGGIKLQGTTIQSIGGSGTGEFGRLIIDNVAGGILTANTTINNEVSLLGGSLNTRDKLLSLGLNTKVTTTGSFSSSRMLLSDGIAGNNAGVKKTIGTGASVFTFPIGVSGKYTPIRINTIDNQAEGSITIKPVDKVHPSVVDPTNALQYYWIVESQDLSNYSGDAHFKYINADVRVSGYIEANYFSGRLIDNTTWAKFDETTVDETTDSIQFSYSGVDNLNGEYTAGTDLSLPDQVPVFQTTGLGTGNWDDIACWERIDAVGPVPIGGPSGFVTIIKTGHTIKTNVDLRTAYKTTINGRLEITSGTVGHNLGIVDGTGTLAVTGTKLPAGKYSAFFDCAGGTLECGGTSDYTLSTIPTIINKLVLTGSGKRIIPAVTYTICSSLDINGTTTLDNTVNNRTIILNGSITRAAGAFFWAGTGINAIVGFNGTSQQSIGALTSFTGTNSFYNIAINNSAGLVLNDPVEMKGNLTLTNGTITTSAANKLTMSGLASTVTPVGGKATSFINGPLVRNMNAGTSFDFPVGSGTRHGKLYLTLVSTGLWEVEYYNAQHASQLFDGTLSAVGSSEYWKVTGPAVSQAKVRLRWDAQSDVTPLTTAGGITDIKVAEYNSTTPGKWSMVTSDVPAGNDYSGTVQTTNLQTYTTHEYTLGASSTLKYRARFSSTSAVCAGSILPITFTALPANYNYSISYSIDGGAPTTISPINTNPYNGLIATTPGVYQITDFKYNSGATTGVWDISTVTVNAYPTVLTNQPVNKTVCEAGNTTIPTLLMTVSVPSTYRWQVSTDGGGSWTNLNNGLATATPQYLNVTTTRLSINKATLALSGYQYRCAITSTSGGCVAYSNVATLSVDQTTVGGSVGGGTGICSGSNSGLLTLTGYTGSVLNWQYSSNNGVSWPNIVNLANTYTSGILNALGPGALTYWYRSVVKNGVCAAKNSSYTIVTVNPNLPVGITIAPLANPVCAGVAADFSSSVSNEGTAPTYKWKLNGSDIGGATGSTYNYIPTNGDGISCEVTSNYVCPTGNPATSSTVTMIVNALPLISSDPINTSVVAGNNTLFSVSASGAGITYQWELSTNLGSTWLPLTNSGVYSTVTTSSLNITGALLSMNGYWYRCVVSGTCAPYATSAAAVLTVNPSSSVSITASPTTICLGQSTTLSFHLTGTAPWDLTYNSGGADIPLTGITPGPTYNLVVTPASAGTTTYTVTGISDSNGPGTVVAPVSVAILVNPLPVVTLAVNPALDSICDGTNTEITFTVSSGATPFDYTVFNGTASETFNNQASPYTFIPSIGNLPVWSGLVPGKKYTYSISNITDNNGCSNTGANTVDVIIWKIPDTGPQYHIPNNFGL